jgi:hypothetical protein
VEVMSDAPSLAFGDLEHLAFETHLLCVAFAELRRHCRERCAELPNLVGALRHSWHVWRSLSECTHAVR